ncbi:MAG: nuclear transport factor 2 family protein [Caulobacteraceae bacterium]|nr:nuclear transport factor 2 family protein [Caulobacteraceae bacterium]
MTLEELGKIVVELKDRQEIRELMSRYGRAVDRLDRELLLSVYHPDATDDHGCYVGSPEVFAECALSMHAEANTATQHIVTNHVCDLDGNTAHTETYWMYVGMNREGAPYSMGGGRYIDRLEKRDGRWGIVARKCVVDWSAGASSEHLLTAAENAAVRDMEPTARDHSDPSYQRPLQVRPERLRWTERILAERRASRRASKVASELLPFYD